MKIAITKSYMCQKTTDNSKFEKELIPSLQRARQEQSAVTVTFKTEVEAIQCQKWALGYGKHRSDHLSMKKKQTAGLCIASRKRNGKVLWLEPGPV